MDCERCGKDVDTHPTVDVSKTDRLALCQERSMKWQRVEPGTVIPVGQPYRIERTGGNGLPEAVERIPASEPKTIPNPTFWKVFVDSSWKPPLVLPTEACVIRANLKHGGSRILFGHPNPGEDGMTFCRAIDGLGYRADEIESFEVLWVEAER